MHHFGDLAASSTAAAGLVLDVARASVGQRGRFSFALSGGGTPLMLYELLARAPLRDQMPWSDTHLFMGDERFVPPAHEHNNFRVVDRILISRVAVPAGQVHPMETDLDTPERSAERYEAVLRDHFPGETPEFDLLLLGLGPDGHTASLFPGDPVLEEKRRWVAGVAAPVTAEPRVPRVTLTLPVINQGRNVVFLVAGEDKLRLAGEILADPASASRTRPAALVQPAGRVLWYLAG